MAVMECKEARELLSPYVDGELAGREALGIAAHVEHCADCRAQHAALDALARGVRHHADYFRAPAALAGRIAAALPLPSVQAVPAPKARHASWTWLNVGAAVASLAAVAWSVALYLALPSADDRLADEVVASHVRSLLGNRAVDVASSDQHAVKPWFNGKVDFSPPVLDLTAEGFPLVGGRVDYLDHRTVAALVYRHRQHMIDVYVSPAAANAKDSPVVKMTRQGYHLLHWTRGGMEFWAISDLDAGELLSLEQILATR
jgi:anti-sigma factor RsiW